MGGKASKDTQGVGLVPRDGTDEIEVLPKKLGNIAIHIQYNLVSRNSG